MRRRHAWVIGLVVLLAGITLVALLRTVGGGASAGSTVDTGRAPPSTTSPHLGVGSGRVEMPGAGAQRSTPAPATDASGPSPLTLDFVVTDAVTRRRVETARVVLFGRLPSAWSPAVTLTRDTGFRSVIEPVARTDSQIRVRWTADGYFTETASLMTLICDVTSSSSEATVELPLEPAGGNVVRVQVIDAAGGVPLRGVTLFSWARGSRTAIAVSNDQGMAEIPTGANHPRVYTAYDGYLPARVPMTSAASKMQVRLHKGTPLSHLTVRIADVSDDVRLDGVLRIARLGPPLDSDEFRAMSGGLTAGAFAAAQQLLILGTMPTDDGMWATTESHWSASGLLPGDYRVIARDGSLGCAEQQVRLSGGEVEVELRLGAGGTVRVSGLLPPGAQVILRPERAHGTGAATTGADVMHVLPGRYAAELRLPSGASVNLGAVAVEADSVVFVDLPPDQVTFVARGRIVERDSDGVEHPVSGAAVSVPGGTPVTSRSDGRFELPGLVAGDYSLRVRGYYIRNPAQHFAVSADGAPSQEIGTFVVSRDGNH